MNEPYLPSPKKLIYHAKDVEYFSEFPAPVMENLQRMHFTNINSTIPYFGPMMYLLIRQFGCEQVLEIGHAEGYTSFYMAHGVKDNAVRFNMQGNKYYGIDIVQTDRVREQLVAEGLPVVLLDKDSMTLSRETFPDVTFDLIFQDGCHDAEHIVYEFNTMWPQLKGAGYGYWIGHDVYGPGEEGCQMLIDKIKSENIPAEIIRFGGMYGLLVIRKMEGYDAKKWKWCD